jgi:hypothetical protein
MRLLALAIGAATCAEAADLAYPVDVAESRISVEPASPTADQVIRIATELWPCDWRAAESRVTIDGNVIDIDVALAWRSYLMLCPGPVEAAVVLGRLEPGRYSVSMRVRWRSPANKMLLSHQLPDAAFEVAPGAGMSGRTLAIEYANAARTRHMVTADQAEIASLDADTSHAWHRTGFAFPTFSPDDGVGSPVCRYYMPPQAGIDGSHAFVANGGACPPIEYYVLETPDAFRALSPSVSASGSTACPAGTSTVSRYMDAQEPGNQRLVSDAAQWAYFFGWTPSGVPAMCVPEWNCRRAGRSFDCQP